MVVVCYNSMYIYIYIYIYIYYIYIYIYICINVYTCVLCIRGQHAAAIWGASGTGRAPRPAQPGPPLSSPVDYFFHEQRINPSELAARMQALCGNKCEDPSVTDSLLHTTHYLFFCETKQRTPQAYCPCAPTVLPRSSPSARELPPAQTSSEFFQTTSPTSEVQPRVSGDAMPQDARSETSAAHP